MDLFIASVKRGKKKNGKKFRDEVHQLSCLRTPNQRFQILILVA